MTDVFCKDSAAQRAGLPAVLFKDAGKKAWRCLADSNGLRGSAALSCERIPIYCCWVRRV